MTAPDLRGTVVWITGVPASGKTTLARSLLTALQARGLVTLALDSDDLRRVLTPQARYTDEERDRFYAAVGHLARLGAEGGAVVVVSATAPRRAHRDAVRAVVPRFVEVYLECDPSVVRARDPKGLYARADRGEIDRLPGAGAPFEAPENPELRVDTTELTPEQTLARTLAILV